MKMHLAGKTDQAKADLARLAIIRKQREEAAKKKDEEKKGGEIWVPVQGTCAPSPAVEATWFVVDLPKRTCRRTHYNL